MGFVGLGDGFHDGYFPLGWKISEREYGVNDAGEEDDCFLGKVFQGDVLDVVRSWGFFVFCSVYDVVYCFGACEMKFYGVCVGEFCVKSVDCVSD